MSLVSLACLKSDLFQEKIKVYILTAGQIHFPSPFALFFLVFQLHSFALLLKIAVKHQLKPQVHVCHHQSFMKDTPWNLNFKLETECQCQFIMIKRNSCKEFKKKKKRLKQWICKYNYLSSHERAQETSWLWCCCPQCHIARILPLDYEQGCLLGGDYPVTLRPITRKLVLNIFVRETDENSQCTVSPGILFVLQSWEEQEPLSWPR